MWSKIGAGNYNTAYRSSNRQWVFKVQHHAHETDHPNRSVRLWNEINASISPPADVAYGPNGEGWVCPYIEGTASTDSEIALALVDIYKRTGRIIVDATAPNNFITQADGKVVCVDIGMALQMERRENEYLSNPKARRPSQVSLNEWDQRHPKYNTKFFPDSHSQNPQATNTIKSLLFIKANRPNLDDADFLKNQPALLLILATAYDGKNVKIALLALDNPIQFPAALKVFEKEKSKALTSIKANCLKELARYIDSRGFFALHGEFIPSRITRVFRDQPLTRTKANDALTLINQIKISASFTEIATLLKTRQPEDLLYHSGFMSGYKITIVKCLFLVREEKRKYDFRLDGLNHPIFAQMLNKSANPDINLTDGQMQAFNLHSPTN